MPTEQVNGFTIEGALNFRDLGGIEVPGGRVASGRLFRSDAPEHVTDAGLQTLDRLNVRVVCDLRTSHERGRNPSRWPARPGPDILELGPAVDLPRLRPERLRSLYDDAGGGRARTFMFELYREMPVAFGPALTDLARRIADHGQVPALVHCAAGRDRTGVVCSMLLAAVGAGQDVILREHVRCGKEFGTARLREVVRGLTGVEPPGAVVDAFRPHPEYLEAAFESATSRHGSLDGYLEAVGVSDARRHRLHDVLVAADPLAA